MRPFLRFLFAGCAIILSVAAADDRAPAAEAAISAAYRAIQDGYARKDVAAIYASYDPKYEWVDLKGEKNGLDENRRSMAESLGKVQSIRVKIEPEAGELVGTNRYMVRYRQTHEIQFPLKAQPNTTWFVAEDTWEKKDGKWRLISTHVVNDSPSEWRARLKAQKKQMQAEDDARASRRCLNGLGYQCGPGK